MLAVQPMSGPIGPGDATQVAGGGAVRLGKYVLDAPLGAGGMAEVFRAHTVGAEGFRRAVAIKRVLPDASRNPAFAEMFVSEAKLSSRMQHPNIVSVLDFDRDHENRLYLVMELVEGRDLDALIESGRLPFSTLIYVVVEMLRGLGYAHDLPAGADGVRGLVHRDVSPHNVLLAWSGSVKVSDFGIAKARAATAASASVTIKGKPAYMSPEQINGSPLDGRSDLFAVGVMMWQMLTGQYLFASGTTAETLARVLFAPVPSPRSVAADVPPDLEAVVLKLLAKEPAQRYATAEDAIDDLLRCHHAPRDGRRELEQLLLQRFPHKAPVRTGQRIRAGLPETPGALPAGTPQTPTPTPAYGTVPLGPQQHAAMNAPTQTSPPVPEAPAHAAPSKSRMGLVIAAIAAVLVLGVVAVIIAASGGSKPEPSTGSASGTSSAALVDAGGAAVMPVDASVEDAAPPTDAAEPIVDAAVPVDAKKRSHRGGGRGSGSSSGGTIQEIQIPGS
jgi:serine/threonine protein kinase